MKIPIYFLSTVFLFLVQSGCRNEARMTQRPNVLFILADDLGAHDLGYTGSTFYETPHLDRLAGESFVFTRGYAGSRVCSPSRASIMLGQFPARHGITDWIGAATGEEWRKLNRYDKLLPPSYRSHLPFEDVTLAEALKQQGYLTFFAGKWHLGSEGSYPEDHGFDINKGGWEKGSPIGGFFSPWTNPKLANRTPGENLSLRLASETITFLEENRDSTFFAFLSFYAVHAPIQTTQHQWSKYQQKATHSDVKPTGYEMERILPIRTVQDNPVYAGLLETMDAAIGDVLDALDELGLKENTIVVFTSDNGGVASGDAFATSNAPLRGGKGYQWEGGLREPYLIYVPWLKSNGKQIETAVSGTDFFPTILDLAGLPLQPEQHLDGTSLKPLMEGRMIPDRALYWHYPHYGNQGGEPSSIIMQKKWKLIHYWEDGREELYQLDVDPGEQQDVSGRFPERSQSLSKDLMDWLRSVDARFPSSDPEYDPEKDAQRDAYIRDTLLPLLEQRRRAELSTDYQPNPDWWGSLVNE